MAVIFSHVAPVPSRGDSDSPRHIEQGYPSGCKIIPFQGEPVRFGEVVTDLRGGVECRFRIHPDLPIYVFHLIGNPADNMIDRIEIVPENTTAPMQVLDTNMGEPAYRDAEYFSAEDMNFDGYQDIKLLAWWGATGNKGYVYWLFDPLKKRFVKNDALSELSNPVPHPDDKTITTHSVGGMGGMIYVDGTYSFDEKGKLILIRLEKQDWIDDKQYFVKTVQERKNGKLMVVSTEIVKR